MTAAEKRERRAVKHDLQKRYRKLANRRLGLCSTPKQIDAAANILTDRFLSLSSKLAGYNGNDLPAIQEINT